MENYKLVMPEHLNHNGFLFGGALLKWVDEYAWIAASLDYRGASFVTIAMDRVEFRRPVGLGTILRFAVEKAAAGRTSVRYRVAVFKSTGAEAGGEPVFATEVALVNLGGNGRKCPLPSCPSIEHGA